MLTAKLLFNSVISTDNARFMGIDISDFYLNSTMPEPEWMWAPAALIPDEVMEAYDLHDKVKNGRVLVRIDGGMYGLPQAGRLAYDQLVKHLKPHGYFPCKRTAGLWRHKTRPISFCLTVDDFGVKYVGKEHADHLIQALNSKYKITTDWEGRLYCGIQLEWNYEAKWVDLSMPKTTSRRCATSSNTTAPHGPSMRHIDGIVRRMARDPSCQNRKTTHHHSTPKASTKFNRWWAAPCTMVEQLIQQFYRRSTASQRNNPKLPSALDKMPRSF